MSNFELILFAQSTVVYRITYKCYDKNCSQIVKERKLGLQEAGILSTFGSNRYACFIHFVTYAYIGMYTHV